MAFELGVGHDSWEPGIFEPAAKFARLGIGFVIVLERVIQTVTGLSAQTQTYDPGSSHSLIVVLIGWIVG